LEGDAKKLCLYFLGKGIRSWRGEVIIHFLFFCPSLLFELLIYVYITFIVKINLILKTYYSVTSGNKNFNVNFPICVKE